MTSLLKTTNFQEPSSSTVNLSLSSSGGLTANNNLTVTNTFTSLTGVTAPIKLRAGTSTNSPINIQNAIMNGAATAAGQIGVGFKIFTCNSVANQNSTLNLLQSYADDNANINSNGTTLPWGWLGTSNTLGVTLKSNTIYAFEGTFCSTKTISGTYTFYTSFGGTATLNWINYNIVRSYGTASFSGTGVVPNMGFIQTASSTTTETAAAAATAYRIYLMKGMVSVNSGGTFIPSASVSLATINIVTELGSYFTIFPIGTAGADVNVGPWA